MKKVILLVMAAVLTGLILIGCGDTTPPKKVDPSKPASSPAEAKKPEVFKVGDSFKLGNLQFTINGVRTSDGSKDNSFLKPKDGNKWVYVDVTVQNVGDKQEVVSSMLMFNLKDKDGVKANITLGDGAKGQVDGNLVVRGKIKGELVYEAPKDKNDFDLEVQSTLAGAVAVVSIKTN